MTSDDGMFDPAELPMLIEAARRDRAAGLVPVPGRVPSGKAAARRLAEVIAESDPGAATAARPDPSTRPDPMPVFTIKAKDVLALDVIGHYEWLCRKAGLTEQAAEVRKAINEMDDWRVRNASAVKLPDHPHVPATEGGAW